MGTKKKRTRKVNKVVPTERQRRAAIGLLENVMAEKPRYKHEILREAGYSEGLSQQPIRVISQKGFQIALMEAGVNEDRLSTILNEGLEAKDNRGGIDYNVRHKYLKTALEATGLLNSVNTQPATTNQTLNVNMVDGDKARERITELIRGMALNEQATSQDTD